MLSKSLCKNSLSLAVVLLAFMFTAIASGSSRFGALSDTIPSSDTSGDSGTFQKVQVEASYPGGESRWLQFLGDNLNGDIPARRNAPEGKYTVLIQFIVDKEGHVTDIKPLTNFGYGMEEEVIRILKMSPTWKPANDNGRPVKAYRKQPVTFVVQLDRKKKHS